MPDPDPLLSQITSTAHETCVFNRVRRRLLLEWLGERIGTDISAKYKARRGTVVLRGSAGKLKVRAHELARIDASSRTLTWSWDRAAQFGPEEPTFAYGLHAAGVQRGLGAFCEPVLAIDPDLDLHRFATEVAFAAVSLLGREYLTYEVRLDDDSWGIFVLDFEDDEPPMPNSADISGSLASALDSSFDPLASLEGLVESEPGWHLAELNATEHILRDPNGDEHIIEGLRQYVRV